MDSQDKVGALTR